ncbi:hypothetical protein [Halospeciosus flavus]|uniref:hypothetical protein n=1 Tax=Halospeciosus flavus TaxID=3032283 RepID=UPI00361BC01C
MLVLRQFDGSRPARIRVRLENSGPEPFHYEYGPVMPFTRHHEHRDWGDVRAVVVPESDTDSLLPDVEVAADANPAGTPHETVDPEREEVPMGLGADVYPGDQIEQTYEVYAYPDDDATLPDGSYRFEGDHPVHRGTAINHGYGGTLSLAFTLDVDGGVLTAESADEAVEASE